MANEPKTRSGRCLEQILPEVPAKRLHPGTESCQKALLGTDIILKKDSEIWIVGFPLEEIKCAGLPTKRQVYLHFRYLKKEAREPNTALKRIRSEDPRFKRSDFLNIIAAKTLESVDYFWM